MRCRCACPLRGIGANDRKDRLQTETVNGAVTSYTYDDNGNTKTKTGNGVSVTYSYDDSNRLIDATDADGSTSYVYDADGLRVRSTHTPIAGTAITTWYVQDKAYAYVQAIEEYTQEGSGPKRLSVTTTFADDLVSQTCYDDTGTPTTRYVQADGFGSTRMLTDENGNITDAIDYDAFGNVIARSGTTEIDHLYRGEALDPNTGFYYLRARYYDPSNGRFLNMDSFDGFSMDPQSLHKYSYTHNDPINGVDPTGHFNMTEIMTSVAVSVTLNLIGTAFGEDHSPQAFGAAAAWGVLEGVAFLGAFKGIVKGARALKSLYFMRQVRKTFGLVQGSGPLIPGFEHLYYQMTVRTQFGKVLLSSSTKGNPVGGALKHVVEEMEKRGAAGNSELAEALAIRELKLVIEKAMGQGFATGKKLYVSTATAEWELIFDGSRNAGEIATLFHAIPRFLK